MTQNFNHQSQDQSPETQAELDLLKSLIESDSPYPWQPDHPNSDSFFSQLDQHWGDSELTSSELESGYEAFSKTLASIWPDSSNLTTRLQQFAHRVPQEILSSIAQQAEAVISSQASLSNQLVQCVQDILPEWGVEDLNVLARPLAYAMRDTQSNMVDTALQAVPDQGWESLSQIERARLTLAIARYALDQAQESEPDPTTES